MVSIPFSDERFERDPERKWGQSLESAE